MRPVFLVAPLLALVPACASAGKPMPDVAAEINATLDTTPARFLPNDTLEVKFANDPNLNQTVRVDSNGNVTLLLVGSFNVAGKRPDQVREELERAYKAKLPSPDLAVNLVQLQPTGDTTSNRTIYVMGEVHNPGSFAFMGQQMTLLDGIAHAGGPLKATALLKNVLLVRWIPDKNTWKGWHIDLRQDHWDSARQIVLQANDLVFIPNTPIDDVNIWIDQYIRLMIPFPYLIPTTLIFQGSSAGR